MTTRQIKAVADALNSLMSRKITANITLAKAAIDASDARFVPQLVEALKEISTIYPALSLAEIISREALAALPEELR